MAEDVDNAAEHPRREPLDEDGRERPQFLLEFPEDPELEPLIEAFCRGNFNKVRLEAPALIEKSKDPKVKSAAEELYRRIQPDPLVKFLLALAAALFVFITAWAYFGHDH